jgi:hypothetical protein
MRADRYFASSGLDRYVEGLNDTRTKCGERRVSARWGWAGETSVFFSILIEEDFDVPVDS